MATTTKQTPEDLRRIAEEAQAELARIEAEQAEAARIAAEEKAGRQRELDTEYVQWFRSERDRLNAELQEKTSPEKIAAAIKEGSWVLLFAYRAGHTARLTTLNDHAREAYRRLGDSREVPEQREWQIAVETFLDPGIKFLARQESAEYGDSLESRWVAE
ncbi:hypothetical protein N566_02035 [Streptomycetaceae bacterium MP113-05]|nr:hypothetical protein N566_02035 [Streptomycetaceae bacterium MP113-05]